MDAPGSAARAEWAAQLGDDVLRRRLVATLSCLHEVEVHAPAAPPLRLRGWVRVAAWNAQRGHRPHEAAAVLRASGAELLLLSELDWGMARTANADTTRDLADALGAGYGSAYGVEFVELRLGGADERAALGSGGDNELGLHGNAIVTRATLGDVAAVRLDDGGRWFGGDSPEPRVGGRMALVATVDLDGTAVRVASTHLENVTDPDGRAAQFEMLLSALGSGPALIGGDLNSFGTTFDEIVEPAVTHRLHSERARFVWPVAHEPLFTAAAEHGFSWEAANVPEPTTTHGPLKIDWLLTRGLDVASPAVLDAGQLSDHHVVVASVRLAR
ncbi:MAG TPA: endonuclease/exonuclease/phosphatase family protein [Acidimicrobiales bacterium]|jgi:endonuclease/exonuclease/phosphatase family metal-dependent hydrolase